MKGIETRDQFLADLDATIDGALNPRQVLPGFASRTGESVNPISMPPWFIDRCRRAYLGALANQVDGARVVGVTSSLRGEGKTSLAIGMATAISADTQRPTLLLECDLGQPSFHRYFGFDVAGGLSDWMEGTAPLRILRGGPLRNLFVIPSGSPRADPSRLFYQLSEGGIVDRIRPHFGTVIIDLPPMLSIAYSSLASQLSDRIVLVARYGITPVDDIEKAIFLLGRERVSGIVLNGTDYGSPHSRASAPVPVRSSVPEDDHGQRAKFAETSSPAPAIAESGRESRDPAEEAGAADVADDGLEAEPPRSVRPRSRLPEPAPRFAAGSGWAGYPISSGSED